MSKRAGTWLGGVAAAALLTSSCGGGGLNEFEVLHGLIVFASDRTGNFELYTMTTYGLNVVQITNSPGTDTEPRWSRNGNQVAFASNRTGDWEIFVMNKDGTGLQNVSNDPGSDDRKPSWSADGFAVLYEKSAAGKTHVHRKVLLGGEEALTSGAQNDWEPCASHSGSKIAFVSDRDGLPQIYTMNPDGSGVQRLLTTAQACAYPVYSPDETKIAFVMAQQLWYVLPDGSGLTQVTDLPGDNTYPIWDPTSRYLLYDTDRDGNWEIYIVGLTGSYLVPISGNPANDVRGDWTL